MLNAIKNLFREDKIYNIDGRTVVIKFEMAVHKKLRKFLTKEILAECRKNAHAKMFPLLEVVFAESVLLGFVSHKDLETGVARVQIGLGKIPLMHLGFLTRLEFSKEIELRDTARETFIHEVAHLWENEVSRYNIVKIKERLNAKLEKKTHRFVGKLRTFMFLIFHGFVTEGIAEYYRLFARLDIPFTDTLFTDLYEESKVDVQELSEEAAKLWQGLRGKRIVRVPRARMHELTYPIGFHIIYSLLFLDPSFNMDKIARAGHFHVIRKYESLMLEKGLTPIISGTSGAGYFDYKKELAKLQAASVSMPAP